MLITFEIGICFMTDFLVGDTSFKAHRNGHNSMDTTLTAAARGLNLSWPWAAGNGHDL